MVLFLYIHVLETVERFALFLSLDTFVQNVDVGHFASVTVAQTICPDFPVIF